MILYLAILTLWAMVAPLAGAVTGGWLARRDLAAGREAGYPAHGELMEPPPPEGASPGPGGGGMWVPENMTPIPPPPPAPSPLPAGFTWFEATERLPVYEDTMKGRTR